MNEPSIFHTVSGTMPLDVVHRIDEPGFAKRTASHAEIHNVYGMQNARATYEGLKKLNPDLRPMVLTRASYAGGQRYGATWTGDNSSTWNHLRLTTPMLENLGLSGFGLSGADVGGFAGTAGAELLTKWLEMGAFQPIDRDHTETGTGDQEPWVGGAEQEAIRRRYIEERYRLMPYLYQLADESSRNGLPMLRPTVSRVPERDGGRASHRCRCRRWRGIHAWPGSPDCSFPLSRSAGCLYHRVSFSRLVRLLDWCEGDAPRE